MLEDGVIPLCSCFGVFSIEEHSSYLQDTLTTGTFAQFAELCVAYSEAPYAVHADNGGQRIRHNR